LAFLKEYIRSRTQPVLKPPGQEWMPIRTWSPSPNPRPGLEFKGRAWIIDPQHFLAAPDPAL